MAYHDVGDTVKIGISSAFASAGVAFDPDVVKFALRDPSGNWQVFVYGADSSVVRSATGIYYLNAELDEAGKYEYALFGYASGGEPNGSAQGFIIAKSKETA